MPDLEFKSVVADIPAALAGAEPTEGVVEALVAVTGVRDEVGDIITPGAFARTLAERKPKVCLGHDWNRPVGKTLAIKELMPGDPGLPKTTADGKPWPAEAGAVLARALFNLEEPDGQRAYRMTKFYGADEQSWSIGYKVVPAKTRKVGDTRHIGELDLFEYSPVLHPANRLALTQMIKDGAPADLETKVRKVKDSSYWGYPVGTPITANMKPRGPAARRLRAEGKTPSRSVGTDESVKPGGGEKPKPIGKRSTDAQRQGQADEAGLFPEPAHEDTNRLKATKPKGKDDEHVASLIEQEDDQNPEAVQAREAAMTGLLEEGITPQELREDLDAADWPDTVDPETRQQLIDEHVADYQVRYNRAVRAQRREEGDASGGGQDGTTPDGTGQEGDNSGTEDGQPAGQGTSPESGNESPDSGNAPPDSGQADDEEPGPSAPDGTPLAELDDLALERELVEARQRYADARKRNAKPGVRPNRKAEDNAKERMDNAEAEFNRRQQPGEDGGDNAAEPPEAAKLDAEGAKALAEENGLTTYALGSLSGEFGEGSFIAAVDGDGGPTPVALFKADEGKFFTGNGDGALEIGQDELGPFAQKLADGGPDAQRAGVPEQILTAMRGGGAEGQDGDSAPEFNAARVANGIAAGRLENLDGLDAEQLAAVDAEMSRRAELLGHPGEVTKSHQAVKDRLEQARQVEPEAPGEPDGGLAPSEAEISREEIDNAEAAANEAMGLFEGPDGELEAAPDVADRQDRVEALLAQVDRDGLSLSDLTDGDLASQRQDLVTELRLQEAVARRDARKRRDGEGSPTPPPAPGGEGGDSGAEGGGSGGGGGGGSAGPTIVKATVRPGVAGAAEDLAEALEGDDEQKLADATARLESSLRRSSSDSEHVQALRTAVAKHGSLKAAIDAGEVTPDTLRKFAEDLRAERREQRNKKARDRRAVKRLERERIRSLISGYDAEMRSRNMDPDRFGGPVPPSSGPSTPDGGGVPDEPTPEPADTNAYPDTAGGRAATRLREEPWRLIDTGAGWDPQPDEQPGDDRAIRRQAAIAAYGGVAREWGWVLAEASDDEITVARERVNKFLDQRGTSTVDLGEMMVIADLLPPNQKPFFRDAMKDATASYSRNLIALREARDRGEVPDAGRPTLGAVSPDRVGPGGRLNALAPRPRAAEPLSSTGTPPFGAPGEVTAHLKQLEPPPGLADYQVRAWESDRDDLVRMIDAAGSEAYVSPGGGLLAFKGDTADGKRWFLISTTTGESIPSLVSRQGVSVQPQLRPETSSSQPFTRYDLDGPAMRRLMTAMETMQDGNGRQVDFTNPDRKSLNESIMAWRDFSGDGVLRPANPDGNGYRYGDNLEAAAVLEAVREDLGRYAGTAALSRSLEAVRRDRDGVNGRSGQQVRQLNDQFSFALGDFNFGRKRKTGRAEDRDREQLKQDKVTGLAIAHAKALVLTGNPADAVAVLRMRAAEIKADDEARGPRFGSPRLEGLAISIKELYSPSETEMARLIDSEEGDYFSSLNIDGQPLNYRFTVAPTRVNRRRDGSESWHGTVVDAEGNERAINIDTGDQYGVRIADPEGGFNVDSYSQNATNSWAAFRAADGQGEPQTGEEVRAASQRQIRAFEAQFGGGDDGGGDLGDDGGGGDQGPDGGPGPSGGERPVAAEGKSITANDIKGGELIALGDESRPGGQLVGHAIAVHKAPAKAGADNTISVSVLTDDGAVLVVPLAREAALTRLDFTDQDMINRMPDFDGPVINIGTPTDLSEVPLGTAVQIMTGSDGDPNFPRRRLAMGEVELGPDGPLLRTTDGRLLSVAQIIEGDDHPYSHPMVEVPFPGELTDTEDRYPDTAKAVKVAPGDRVQAFVSVDIPGEYATGRWLDGWVETIDPDNRNVQVRLPSGALLNIDTNEGEPGVSRMLRRKGGPTKATMDAVDTRDVGQQSYRQYIRQGGNAALAVSALRTRVMELIDSTRDNRPNANEGIAPRSIQLQSLADSLRDAEPDLMGFLPTLGGKMIPGKLVAAFGGHNDPDDYSLDLTAISPQARTAAVEFYRDYVATMLERAAASAEEFERIDDDNPDRMDNRIMAAVRRSVEGSPTTVRLGRQLAAALAESQLKRRASLPDDDQSVSIPKAKHEALEKAVQRERWNQYKRVVTALALDGHRLSAPLDSIDEKWDRDSFDAITRGVEKELRAIVGDDNKKFQAVSGDIARAIKDAVLEDIRARGAIDTQHSKILNVTPGKRLSLPKAALSSALGQSLEEATAGVNGVQADPSKPLAARVAALREQIGPHGFGLIGISRYEIVGGVGITPNGRVELNEAMDTKPDVAEDGGPGRKTLRDLAVLRAIGAEVKNEAARLHQEKMTGDELRALRDEEEKTQAEATQLRDGFVASNELVESLTDEVLALARADGREAHRGRTHMMVKALLDPDWQAKLEKRTALAPEMAPYVYKVEQTGRGLLEKARAERKAYEDALQRNMAAELARRKFEKNALSESRLEALAQIREFGQGDLKWAAGPLEDLSGGDLATLQKHVSRHYPSDWIATAQGLEVGQYERRGYYDHTAEKINIGSAPEGGAKTEDDPVRKYGRVSLHEQGHHFEKTVPGLLRAEWAFHYSRTSYGPFGDRKREAIREMSKVTGISSYGSEEVTIPDRFPEPYTGKVYSANGDHRTGAWELFTTGVESLFAGSNYLDDDFETWMLGTMAGV